MFASVRSFPAVALVLVLTLLWVVGWYWHTARDIAGIWWRSETFAHGLVVLPAFAWLVWRARDRINGVALQPIGWMAVPVLAAGALWLLGGLVSVAAAQHFALFVMLVCAFVGVLGWRLGRVLLFPLLFLFFGVPIGEFMLPTLMHYTAEFTVWALRLSGVPVYQEGLHFIVPNGRWSVVEACSGVRYLIASLFVGALYAYLNYSSLKRRLVFMVLAFIVPIFANWLRAYIIVMLGYLSDNTIAAGVDHLIYGSVFFGVVIFALFWLGSRWQEPDAAACAVVAHTDSAVRTRWVGVLPVALAVAVFPPLLAKLDAPVPDFPVSLSAPLPAMGWKAAALLPYDYRPTYTGARAAVTQTYVGDSAPLPVGLYAAWYVGQRDGSEMVGWGNGPVPAGQGEGALVRMARSLSIDGHSLQENLITTPGGRILTWHWYRMNGHSLVRDAEVKLRLARDRLLGRPDESAVALLSTPIGAFEEEANARQRLQAFLADHVSAIDSALDAAVRSLPQ